MLHNFQEASVNRKQDVSYDVKALVGHPLVKDIESLDGVETYRIHREIITSKLFLVEIYRKFYEYLLSPFKGVPLGQMKIVEVGAGAFNANYFFPEIITSDLDKTEFVKEALDAQNMGYEDASLDGIILIDVLHHIPKVELFFNEVKRTLRPGGKLVMIEPYYSPWGSLIYKKLHHEPWSDCESWDIPEGSSGRLSGANMKMPHNIFIRDIEKFKELYPDLKINEIEKINFFYYLLSGGLSYKNVIPKFFAPLIFFVEFLLSPLAPLLAMNMVIEIEKKR